ncbi:DUF4393 domain-containing protein [Bacillus sp. EAC]|uniref:DUF4393 domain-containing protein n=1 Tax=Bacillus sp. EAC TaxID=1978338 RepID=UPI000B435B86|nr:DUF4393 domain-containing protein [Bacillus sp. EAC]
MDITTLTTAGTAIGTTLLTNFVTKGESAPLQTLNDAWYLVFGNLHFVSEKKRAKHKAELDLYMNDIVKEVSLIPDENLIEPRMRIVGPALDASKYYIEEGILRKMFAKVVASSMDNRQSSNVHPSFVEIIKQLSPLDANNIKLFIVESQQPICKYKLIIKETGNYRIFKDNVYLQNNEVDDIDLLSTSITNLIRLGLLDVNFVDSISNINAYKNYYNHPTYTDLKTFFENPYIYNPESQELFKRYNDIQIEKGVITITALGKAFINVCVEK